MRQHLSVTLQQALFHELPYWGDVVRGLRKPSTSFFQAFDQIMSHHNIGFQASEEFSRRDQNWSQEEFIQGFDREYRIVLMHNTAIPDDIIQDIRLLPQVKDVRFGAVTSVDISPRMTGIQFCSQPVRVQPLSMQPFKTKQSWAHHMIGVSAAQRYHRGRSEIKIAVLDTGVDLDHPELQNSLLPGFDFVHILSNASAFLGDYLEADDLPDDEVGHGSHVAGIIAGQGMHMPVGVVPQCSVIPVRVLAPLRKNGMLVGAGLIDNINSGIKWAVDQGADIINMSLGVAHTGGGLPHENVVRYALRRGVSIVAASGNDGQEKLYYPGGLQGVITVGAVDQEGQVSGFSTYGHQVSVVAPGVDIYSCALHQKYAFSTGTSHAAPFVSGALALWKGYALTKGMVLNDAQLKHVLKQTCDRPTNAMKTKKSGYGRLNILDGLKLIDHKCNGVITRASSPNIS